MIDPIRQENITSRTTVRGNRFETGRLGGSQTAIWQGETAVQTLKTAAIVVLLMTVLYGAYVSMTTPPDPLPQGVESMLVESGLDDFPDDFDDFGIDSGTLEELSPPTTVASDTATSN